MSSRTEPHVSRRRLAASTDIRWKQVDMAARLSAEAAIARLVDRSGEGPIWEVRELLGGATNLNFMVTIDGIDHVLRVSDYDQERMGGTRGSGFEVQSAAAAGGIAAPVVACSRPEGHCLSRFIDGDALDLKSFRERELLAPIARLLRRMHDLPRTSTRWSAFSDIARYTEIARREGLEMPKDVDELLGAVGRVEEVIVAIPGAEGFCHNDLQIQNFILDEDGRLWLIDWEWAGAGNRYFDLGGFVVNTQLTAVEMVQFVEAYFEASSTVEIELARIELMRLVSAVREATWSIVAEPVLKNDWDYRTWASDYFDRARSIVEGPRFDQLLQAATGSASER